jgi:hypothetical protein
MASTTSTTINNNDVPSNFHTVTICADLPKVNKYYSIDNIKDLPPIDYWIDKMDEKVDKACYKVQHIIANGPCEYDTNFVFLLTQIFLYSDTSSDESHAIFSAFLFAYNSHEDIVLSPDDIWLMICIYFSQYINDNAEQLRTLFVDHDDRKRLTVVQTALVEPE